MSQVEIDCDYNLSRIGFIMRSRQTNIVRFLVFSGEPRSDSRNKRLKSVYPLPQAFLLPSRDPFSPRICLKTRLPFSSRARNGPRKVLLLPGGYHCQAVDIKDPLYISPWLCGGG